MAGSLPDLGDADAARVAGAVAGLVGVVAMVAFVAPAHEALVALALGLAGTAVLCGAFEAADAGAAATPAEVAAGALVGAWLARLLHTPVLVLVLPAFVAVVAAVSGDGATWLDATAPSGGDPLVLDLSAWASEASVARLGPAEPALLAILLAWAPRPGASALAVAMGLTGAVALHEVADVGVAPFVAIAVAWYAANLDRVPGLLRTARWG